jgi:glycosyltransferase involved in cell wall biosynthesis
MTAGVSDQSDWAVGVVVPARDEEDSIVPCIQSVTQALDACPGLRHTWVAIVADSCSDRTVARATEALGSRGVVLECAARSPGVARRIGVGSILDRFARHAPNALWIANTDADSSVSRKWIGHQLSLAAQGYCAVAGIVHVESVADLEPQVVRELLSDYTVNADGSHSHVHGANFGIRADAYLDAGGWSHLALAEDHCLWRRVRARNWRVISSAQSVVTTSGRLAGRAIGGFADELRRRIDPLHA